MNNLEIKISKMEKSQLDEVAKILKITFDNVGDNWNKRASIEHVKLNFLGNAHYVATLENKIIGILLATPLIEEQGAELFIDIVAVLPEYKGKGVGKMLLQQAENFASQNNLSGIRLLATQNLNSYKWYKSLDYNESGWVELYKPIQNNLY